MDTLVNTLLEHKVYLNFDPVAMRSYQSSKKGAPPADLPLDSTAFVDLIESEADIEEQICEEGCAIVHLVMTLCKKTYTRKMARLLLDTALLPFKSTIKEHSRKRQFDIQLIVFAVDMTATLPTASISSHNSAVKPQQCIQEPTDEGDTTKEELPTFTTLCDLDADYE